MGGGTLSLVLTFLGSICYTRGTLQFSLFHCFCLMLFVPYVYTVEMILRMRFFFTV